MFTITQGWLSSATRYDSPHCDARPPSCEIDAIILHAISLPPEDFSTDAITQFFMGHLDPSVHPYFQAIHHLRVSAHFVIHRDGRLLQFVPLHLRAWHAGVSELEGRGCCNDFSIGIELEGSDTQPFTDQQYAVLVPLIRTIMHAYPAITPARIVGHSDIAPGRKTDPGPHFNWDRFRNSLFNTV